MKRYKIIEEFDLLHEDGYNLTVPENTIIKGYYNGDVWKIEFNGVRYFQYNYSIEDKIEEI